MRRLLGAILLLGVCLLTLAGCRGETDFYAGESLSATELEELKNSLLQNEEDEASVEENRPDETPVNGENSEADQENASSSEFDENKTVVYYTENGSVYHTDRDCTYLKNSKSVLNGSIAQAESLGKSRECSACASEEESESSTEVGESDAGDQLTNSDEETGEIKTVVYYTEGGAVYHKDRNCTYLKNSTHVLEGALEGAVVAGKNRPCSRCGD